MVHTEELDVRYQEGLHYYEMNRYERAKVLFLQVLETDPEDADLLVLIAHCCLMLKEYDEAHEFCVQGFQAGQPSIDNYRIMAQIQMSRHSFVEAEQYLLEGLSLHPHSVELIATYSTLMALTGFMKKAFGLLKEAQKIDGTHPATLYSAYLIYSLRLNSKDAFDAATAYWNSSNNSVHKYKLLGDSALQRKKFRLAREMYREAFLLDPTDEELIESLQSLDELLHPICWPALLFQKFNLFYIYIVTVVLAITLILIFGAPSIFVVGASYLCLRWCAGLSPHVYRFYQRYRR